MYECQRQDNVFQLVTLFTFCWNSYWGSSIFNSIFLELYLYVSECWKYVLTLQLGPWQEWLLRLTSPTQSSRSNSSTASSVKLPLPHLLELWAACLVFLWSSIYHFYIYLSQETMISQKIWNASYFFLNA